MTLKIRASGLPGVTTERVISDDSPNELHREDIERDGVYIGQVVYVRRKRSHGSDYGWRPAKNTRAALSTKSAAICKLPKYL
jgi:hypothetical protein